MSNAECAKVFVNAIKTMASKPENLQNFQQYLENHFNTWLKEYANTPARLAHEMKQFAEMEI